MDSLAPSDVFACENNTVFFYQDEEFFLATGEMRFYGDPVVLVVRLTNQIHMFYRPHPPSPSTAGVQNYINVAAFLGSER